MISTKEQPTKTVMVQNGRKRIHMTWPNETECIEEYDLKTEDLVLRKWTRKTKLGAQSPWEIEVGEIDKVLITGSQTIAGSDVLLRESATNPCVIRRDTKSHFVWRIRNLHHEKSTYDIKIENNKIYVRTSSKKYFKIIRIPDMERAGIPLAQSELYFDWANSILMIAYKKPLKIVEMEKIHKSSKDDQQVQCPQS